MSLGLPDRDALFSSPFGFSHSRSQSLATGGDSSFPRCSIQLEHEHAPFVLSYYCAPPHLPPSHPLFSHLLSSFLTAVQSTLGVVPVAFEGTDGLLYPPTVMLQLPAVMLEGKAFRVVAEQREGQGLGGAEAGRAAQAGRAAAADDEDEGAEAWDRRARYKQKKSVSFGNGISERPAAVLPSGLPSPSSAAVHAASSFTAAHLLHKHPVPISTQFASTRLSLASPQAPSPVPQSPALSPLPSSLLAPSVFPLPTYTTSIPLLRSLLSSAFFPVSLSSLPALFMAHSVQPAGSAQRLLPRSAFLPLMAALRNTAAASSSQRQSAVLSCFLSHFFSFLDSDDDDGVEQASFIAGLALLLPLVPDAGGEEVDQLTVAFRLLDRGGKGWVTPAALFAAACRFVPTLLSLSHPLSASASSPSAPSGIAVRSAFDLPSLLAAVYEIAGKMVREAFGCGDTDIDGRLSEDEFRALHLSRPSCLPWVNVLVDPERAAMRAAAADGGGGGGADVSLAGAGGGSAAAGLSAGGQRRAEHGRSASLPVRVELAERRRGRDWDDKGSEPQQQQTNGGGDEEDEDEDDDEDDEDDDDEDEEEAAQEEARDALEAAATASAASFSSAASSSLRHAAQKRDPELEEAIDAVMQLKMLQLTSSMSGSGSKRRGRSAEAAGREAGTWVGPAVLVSRSASEPHDAERKAAAAAAAGLEDDDDAERTEAFLDQMWQEMRRLNAGQKAAARRRTKRWSNDNSGQEEQLADGDADGQQAAEEEEMLAVQQRASSSSHAPYSLPLSATVTAPRLSSLCTSSSFLSIHPHIAPFSSLQLESLLELFHLLTAHSASLQRADVPRLVANMALGQSASSQQSMLDTMRCLFTCQTLSGTQRTASQLLTASALTLSSSPLRCLCVAQGSTRTRTTASTHWTWCWLCLPSALGTAASSSTSASPCATWTPTAG